MEPAIFARKTSAAQADTDDVSANGGTPPWVRRVPADIAADETFWLFVTGVSRYFRRALLFFPLALLSVPFYATGLYIVGDVIFVGLLVTTFGSAVWATRHLPGVREQLALRRRYGRLRLGFVYMYSVLASVARLSRST
jgi:hypothetical protein